MIPLFAHAQTYPNFKLHTSIFSLQCASVRDDFHEVSVLQFESHVLVILLRLKHWDFYELRKEFNSTPEERQFSMGWWITKERSLKPELMDDPNLDESLHRQALAGLRRVNWISRTHQQLASQLTRLIRKNALQQPSILDIACGGGDVARGVHHVLHQHCIDAILSGWDLSPTAIAQANSVSSNVNFQMRDVFEEALSEPVDISYCTLFLHHLDREQSIRFLKRMRSISRVGAIVSDLKRSDLGWIMAQVGCQLLSRSPIVHYDGPQSVRAAWTTQEAKALARDAGWDSIEIISQWPQRFFMIGQWK